MTVHALSVEVAATCECERPIPNGPDCEKCGKPRERPVVEIRRADGIELERRQKIAAYWRGRRRVPVGSKDGVPLR